MTRREAAEAIVRTLRGAGHTAYFAGGCVRDDLLGRAPKDYDIAGSAAPEEVANLFPSAKSVGAHFGVMLVREGGFDTEVATFREDGPYLDGRRPSSVTFSGPAEDARRRDFTVNGLFFDPVDGRVIDYVGGRDDLAARVIRAIGEPAARFREDYLRLLRAVRLAADLAFEIDPETWRAVTEFAPHIEKIAVERVREEFSRTLAGPNRVRGFDLLMDSGLMAQIIPEVLDLRGCQQPPQFHPEGDVFVHTRIMLDLLPPNAPLPLVLATLLHDIGKPPTFAYDEAAGRIRFNEHDKIGAAMSEKILRRLKYSKEMIERVSKAVEHHMVFKDVQKMRTSRLKRFMARPHFDDELELHRVDCASSHGMLDNYEFLQQKADEFALEPIIPPPLVTGHDLIQMGHYPGPAFKEILEDVQNRQLEGSLTDRDAALDYVRAAYPAES